MKDRCEQPESSGGELSLTHIEMLEDAIKKNEFIDDVKMLKHLNGLQVQLINKCSANSARLFDIRQQIGKYTKRVANSRVVGSSNGVNENAKISGYEEQMRRMEAILTKSRQIKKFLLKLFSAICTTR
ncbi:hypothetical protein GWR56_13610 [Mucilaginibacter sp. 14171R-50]|uniref:hypothetical protein n=1 Tax=Mucilaginibacter sp. 14171R-50 TaxID=2703789 RepID=UPI00138B51BA|nr:hypothetical protein [Mucilaginibacter sp. 14171R-50]QHS56525.1 hypothetical protein GWR56_13610 [Mucilaginibacter sp. 14171R-50]